MKMGDVYIQTNCEQQFLLDFLEQVVASYAESLGKTYYFYISIREVRICEQRESIGS